MVDSRTSRWPPPRLIVLIAWLDYCLQVGISFLATVEDHLRQQREQHPTEHFGAEDATIEQIKQKLSHLARSCVVPKYQKPFPSRDDVLKKGSVCFPGLDSVIKEGVDATLARYQSENQTQSPSHTQLTLLRNGSTPTAPSVQELHQGSSRTRSVCTSNLFCSTLS